MEESAKKGFSRKDFLRLSGSAFAGAYVLGLADRAGADSLPGASIETGYGAWLRYLPVADGSRLKEYRQLAREVVVDGKGTLLGSARNELVRGLSGMLNQEIPVSRRLARDGSVVIGTEESSILKPLFKRGGPKRRPALGPEGFFIRRTKLRGKDCIAIGGETQKGALNGAFAFLRLLQLYEPLAGLNVEERPTNPIRMMNHWDNLDGSVERGYAGESILWEGGETLTGERQRDHARLLASVGINGISINNVNSDPRILESEYIGQVASLADVFRDYGIKVYISANFFSPISVGSLDTADPLDGDVRKWWKEKADEIYEAIPDFGGFLVKADSEGQPGPYEYGRTHAEGANTLAAAVEPYGGLVIWRAFVYGQGSLSEDRAKQAFENFRPLDGEFADNAIVQVKNGPIDFQVREPVSPLFGQMPRTNLTLELQVTQEYTGQQVHLCYLVPQWKKVLDFDTQADGEGSTVKKVADGTLHGYEHSGLAGVTNIGSDQNWFGHHLAGANAYGFSRLAWNPDLSSEEIAEEWVRMTFGHDREMVETITSMLMGSWPTYERYTSPLGVGFMCEYGAHFDPAPEVRYDYHRADSEGVGFDRTQATGSGYTQQYHPPVAEVYEHLESCPEHLLLFFHHVPYVHELKKLSSGKTVIQHIYDTHFDGVDEAERLREQWINLRGKIGSRRHREVLERFDRQVDHAGLWRDTVTEFFFEESGIPDEKGRVGLKSGARR